MLPEHFTEPSEEQIRQLTEIAASCLHDQDLGVDTARELVELIRQNRNESTLAYLDEAQEHWHRLAGISFPGSPEDAVDPELRTLIDLFEIVKESVEPGSVISAEQKQAVAQIIYSVGKVSLERYPLEQRAAMVVRVIQGEELSQSELLTGS